MALLRQDLKNLDRSMAGVQPQAFLSKSPRIHSFVMAPMDTKVLQRLLFRLCLLEREAHCRRLNLGVWARQILCAKSFRVVSCFVWNMRYEGRPAIKVGWMVFSARRFFFFFGLLLCSRIVLVLCSFSFGLLAWHWKMESGGNCKIPSNTLSE